MTLLNTVSGHYEVACSGRLDRKNQHKIYTFVYVSGNKQN